MKLWLILSISALIVIFAGAAFSNYKQINKTVESAQPMPVKTDGAEGERTLVIVELFTSEGCSSCPPADEVLARLERTQPVPGAEIIALGEHVDYWNYIGWADPFSSTVFSERQNAYAGAFSNSGIYTPQMVVDGQTEFVGSKMNKALDAIAKAARAPKAKVEITHTPGDNEGAFSIQVRATQIPAVNTDGTVEIILAITESDLQSNVSRGENAGRRLNHGAVVRQLNVVGSGQVRQGEPFIGKASVTTLHGWRRDHLRVVTFLQERNSRKIIGSASLKLASLNL